MFTEAKYKLIAIVEFNKAFLLDICIHMKFLQQMQHNLLQFQV